MEKITALLFIMLFPTTKQFNIDTKHTYQEYSIGQSNSQFGYTVSFYQNKLFVGAPSYNISYETGGIFSCGIKDKICGRFDAVNNLRPLSADSEIKERARTAKSRMSNEYITITIQNMYHSSVDFIYKGFQGEEHDPDVTMKPKRYVRYATQKGKVYIARDSSTFELLYFINEDNEYDITFRAEKLDAVISIASLDDAKSFIHRNSNGKMGLTMMTLGKQLIACEPKYKMKYMRPMGRCTVFEDNKVSFNVAPCEQRIKSGRIFGYCISGISIAGIAEYLFVGSPNPLRIAYITAASTADGKLLSEYPHRIVGSDALMGYALSTGRFENNENVIIGAPRGTGMVGKVLLTRFSKDVGLDLLEVINSPDKQIGSYFGATLCTADCNDDGKDDLFVGSPYYSKVYDEGRVHIYMSKKGAGYVGVEHKYILEGKGIAGERFGSTIVNIGDINNDGFIDIAVGAPGGGKGSVYIFNSNANGIIEKYSQVISASDIPNSGAGFGISIVGNIDIDSNSYSDIAVGAYLGGKAYIFKSRPVIKLQATQTVNVSSIPPESKYVNCHGPDKNGYHCITLDIELFYEGLGTPDTFDLKLTYEADAYIILKRAKLLDSSNNLVNMHSSAVTVQRGVKKSVSKLVLVKINDNNGRLDIFSPMQLVTSYQPVEKSGSCGQEGPCAVLKDNIPTSSMIAYAIRCANNSFCLPDLDVRSVLRFPRNVGVKEVTYGVTEQVVIASSIKNVGETAYQPQVILQFHSDFDVDNVKIGDKILPIWDVKDANGTVDTKELSFFISSAIHTNGMVNVEVQLSIIKPKPTVIIYTFTTEATAVGTDLKTQLHNRAKIEVDVKVETCIQAAGDAVPSHILYDSKLETKNTNATVSNLGLSVIYTFYVQNSGRKMLDSLIAEVNMVDGANGVKMCIDQMVVNQVPCSGASNCDAHLKALGKSNDPSGKPENNTVMCSINSIKAGRGAEVKMRARIYSVAKLDWKESDVVTNIAVRHSPSDILDIYYQRVGCSMTKQVNVTLRVALESSKEPVPIWIIIVSAIAALLLLLACVILLLKRGFFKRKRVKDISAPLNEQGDANSDEDEDEGDI